MFQTNEDQFYESALFQAFGTKPDIRSAHFVSGGCINNTVRLETSTGDFFIKWNEDPADDFFEKEVLGLELLASANVLNTPEVLHQGRVDMRNFLILEYIKKGAPVSDFWEMFGVGLANQHKQTSENHGLGYNNFIGRLPQKNEPMKKWVDFFIENRLEVQLGLALYNEHIDLSFTKKFRRLYPQLPGLLPEEPASLLHGDLWSGNFMVGPDGLPVIFDPAVYYGNREAELAFTTLFGGFDRLFYLGYTEEYPLVDGFRERADIYNLYPLLVHVNLFGPSYLAGVEKVIRKCS